MNALTVLRHPGLSPAAKLVWLYLNERREESGYAAYTGSVWQLARGVGVHERTVFVLLRQLEEAGLIRRERRGIHTNAIYLHAPRAYTLAREAGENNGI